MNTLHNAVACPRAWLHCPRLIAVVCQANFRKGQMRASTATELQAILKKAKKASMEELVQAHHQAAKLMQHSGAAERVQLSSMMVHLQGRLMNGVTKCNARQLTSLLDALHRAGGMRPAHLFVQSVVREVSRPSLLSSLDAHNLTLLAGALSRHTQRLHSGQAAADPGGTTTLQQLLGTAWAGLAARAAQLAQKMRPESACYMLAALARARHYDASVMDVLLNQLQPAPSLGTASPTAAATPAAAAAAATAAAAHVTATSTAAVAWQGGPPGPPGSPAHSHQPLAACAAHAQEAQPLLPLDVVGGALWACATFMHPHDGLQQLAMLHLHNLRQQQLQQKEWALPQQSGVRDASVLHASISAPAGSVAADHPHAGKAAHRGRHPPAGVSGSTHAEQHHAGQTSQRSKERSGNSQGGAQPSADAVSGPAGNASVAHSVANMAWSAAVLGGASSPGLVHMCTLCLMHPCQLQSRSDQESSAVSGTLPATAPDPVVGPTLAEGQRQDVSREAQAMQPCQASQSQQERPQLWQSLRPAAAAQVLQALLLTCVKSGLPPTLQGCLQLLGGWGLPPAAALPMVQACQTAWCSTVQEARPSATQLQVFQALQWLGADPQLEHASDDGLFNVDMSATWRGQAVAVEVDGPTHFCASPPSAMQRPLGATHARRALLHARGLRLLHIQTEEWHRLRAQGDALPSGLLAQGDALPSSRVEDAICSHDSTPAVPEAQQDVNVGCNGQQDRQRILHDSGAERGVKPGDGRCSSAPQADVVKISVQQTASGGCAQLSMVPAHEQLPVGLTQPVLRWLQHQLDAAVC